MPIPIVPVATPPSDSEKLAPEDGDFVDGASIQQTVQPIWDEIASLEAAAKAFTGLALSGNANITGDISQDSGGVTTLAGGIVFDAAQGGVYSAAGSGLGNLLPFDVDVVSPTTGTIARNRVTYVESSGGSANFTKTIFGIDQQNGDWIIFRNGNTTYRCTVQDPDGNTIQILGGDLSIKSMLAVKMNIGGTDYWIAMLVT